MNALRNTYHLILMLSILPILQVVAAVHDIPTVIYISSDSNIDPAIVSSKLTEINAFLAGQNQCDTNYTGADTGIALCIELQVAEKCLYDSISD